MVALDSWGYHIVAHHDRRRRNRQTKNYTAGTMPSVPNDFRLTLSESGIRLLLMSIIALFILAALVTLLLETVLPREYRETFDHDDFRLTLSPVASIILAMTIHIQTKTLPDSLKSALSAVGYGAADVAIEVTETYSAQAFANDGQRGFTMAVNLATGERHERQGSWGGANPFSANAVDSDGAERPLAPGFAVVQGTTGYPRTFATILLHPSNAAPLLPAKAGLTDRQRRILTQFGGLTSAGRKDEWERNHESRPTADEIAKLVAAGMLKQNKAGALSITTEGKNNRARGVL